LYFEACSEILRTDAVWHAACFSLCIAHQGKLRRREKKMAKKTGVKKGTKLSSVKPLTNLGKLGKTVPGN
jgi:hypothetical protein